jgi:hypothetical protein
MNFICQKFNNAYYADLIDFDCLKLYTWGLGVYQSEMQEEEPAISLVKPPPILGDQNRGQMGFDQCIIPL